MLPKAYIGAAKAGIYVPGPAMSIYFTWDRKTRFTAGPIVAGGAPARANKPDGDGLGVRGVLGCMCATAYHVGPHEELEKTHNAVSKWIDANGFESRMPIVDVYVDDWTEVEPEKMKTVVHVPIVPKGNASV